MIFPGSGGSDRDCHKAGASPSGLNRWRRDGSIRKGHDGLASLAQAELGFAPKAGVMVVFRSRRGDRVKVLFWDGNGIVMIYKRLEQGGFAWPKVGDGVMRLSRVQFEALFAG